MKIAIAKPDWGITGGFEFVVDRIAVALEDSGHDIRLATVSGAAPSRVIRSVDVPDSVWAAAPEFFIYASLLDRFSRLDVSDADLVITTQPGSWGVSHDRKLAVFYHHHRVSYDLEDAFTRSGLAPSDLHHAASELLRRLDAPSIESVAHFLVPSKTVANRLTKFNAIDESRMSMYLAAAHHNPESAKSEAREHVLCVSRSEFTKRTELFVAAAHDGFDAPANLVGAGGRLPFVCQYAADMSSSVQREPDPWWSVAEWTPELVETPPQPVSIHGWLGDGDLAQLYSSAAVVVAPAFNEDYGLTVLEAMSHGKPVVVCQDGGGLVEFVDDGETGYVVEPNPKAVAAAVRTVIEDPAKAMKMGEAARAKAACYTWEKAAGQLLAGVDAALERA